MNNSTNIFSWWAEAAESSIPFWKNWGTISESQRKILENYRNGFFEEFQKFLQLAPNNLSQTINPWSFSLISLTQQMKGQPATEYKILTQVAGYGSQLGTILDFLQVLENECGLDEKKLRDPKQIEAVQKFRDLVRSVNAVKKEVGR